MFRFDIVLNLSVLLVMAVVLYFVVKRKDGPLSAVYSLFFSAALFFAYIIKLNLPTQATSVFLPFNKLFHIYEHGYAGVLKDLLIYAAPYLAAGFFFRPAFPRSGIAASTIFGVMFVLVSSIYSLLNTGVFVTDEYLLAGLGMGAGCGLYGILVYTFRHKPILAKLKLPQPRRRSFIFATILWGVLYVGIALLLIFNFSRPYEALIFDPNEFPLPDKMELNCALSKESSEVFFYTPSSTPLDERILTIAQSVGIDNAPVFDGSVYSCENQLGKVTMTESGSWVYDNFENHYGALPTQESAANAAFSFFAGKELLSVEIDEVLDIVERTDSATGCFSGFDVFLSTGLNGHPIVDSSIIVVTVRAGNAIDKVRRYDGDIEYSGQIKCISPEKAYARLFTEPSANTLNNGALSATVNGCELAYMKNSQGYYLPVWRFFCTAKLFNGTEAGFTVCTRGDK